MDILRRRCWYRSKIKQINNQLPRIFQPFFTSILKVTMSKRCKLDAGCSSSRRQPRGCVQFQWLEMDGCSQAVHQKSYLRLVRSDRFYLRLPSFPCPCPEQCTSPPSPSSPRSFWRAKLWHSCRGVHSFSFSRGKRQMLVQPHAVSLMTPSMLAPPPHACVPPQ